MLQSAAPYVFLHLVAGYLRLDSKEVQPLWFYRRVQQCGAVAF